MKIDQSSTIGVLDATQHCEPSGFLFNKAIRFLSLNDYDLEFADHLKCSVVLINTCCVTQSKIKEAEKLIKAALNEENVKIIIIYGCYSKFFKSESNNKKIVRIGPKEFKLLEEFFVFRQSIEDVEISSLDPRVFEPYQRGITNKDYFILICQGCIHHCSYCNIKNAKGKTTSRTHESIIKDIQEGVRAGNREFVLLADDCGSYGVDLGTDLVELMKEILSRWGDVKVKISTFSPGDFIRLYPQLREFINNGNISYINIPIQSGSKRILGLMNRNYDVNSIIEIVKEIKGLNPSVWLYTHILINFPTETMDDFTVSLKVAFVFDDFLVLPYSENPLTASSKISPKISPEEQEERIKIAEAIVLKKKKGAVVGHMSL